ncbi:hypothetical protein PoB_004115300 [Plakobranchus ocellatus]|uniref:Uncharacterized protein n=1 Tax=Plakobranchus ocellatus TaxID=259542 RepID=A0AAV4B4Z6_9GAST|nr:hypothetical protein PoB_004115300 [Plakobranchus ocellatus]
MEKSPHSLTDHMACVDKMCRICANKVQNNNSSKKFLCVSYSSDILLYFNIDTSNDTICFSKYMCSKCYSRLCNIKRRPDLPNTLLAAREVGERGKDVWVPFDKNIDPSECSVCTKYSALRKGGQGITQRKRLKEKWKIFKEEQRADSTAMEKNCNSSKGMEQHTKAGTSQQDSECCIVSSSSEQVMEHLYTPILGVNTSHQATEYEQQPESYHLQHRDSNSPSTSTQMGPFTVSPLASTSVQLETSSHPKDYCIDRSLMPPGPVSFLADLLSTPTILDCETSSAVSESIDSSFPICQSTPLSKKGKIAKTPSPRLKKRVRLFKDIATSPIKELIPSVSNIHIDPSIPLSQREKK